MKIVKTKDLNAGASVLIYGDSGTGKTTLFGTLPEKETLIIDIDRGLASLSHANIDRVAVESDLSNFKEIVNAIVDKTDGMGKYNYICLDSITELGSYMLVGHAKVSKNAGVPALKDYLAVQMKMRGYLRDLRDLKYSGRTFIATALEQALNLEQSDGIVRTKLYPHIPGGTKLAPEVCGLFDVVGHLEVQQTGEYVGARYIRLDPTDKIVAKNRFSNKTYTGASLVEVLTQQLEGETQNAV